MFACVAEEPKGPVQHVFIDSANMMIGAQAVYKTDREAAEPQRCVVLHVGGADQHNMTQAVR